MSERTEPESGRGAPGGPERLQKLISRAGLASRRVAEQMIADGRVAVDGRTARLGDRADARHAKVTVDGVPLPVRPDLVHYLVNKPLGVISTARDPQGRPTVIDLVPAEPRVFTVGRLDANTTGLLILTNDGELAERITHPRYEVTKTYIALVAGRATVSDVRRLEAGVELEDGPAAAVSARLVDVRAERSQVEIVLREGRNREVRRMCEAIGFPVVALHRIAIGNLRDPDLKPGQYRPLDIAEIRDLYEQSGLDG